VVPQAGDLAIETQTEFVKWCTKLVAY
jgi:hypothetical protein